MRHPGEESPQGIANGLGSHQMLDQRTDVAGYRVEELIGRGGMGTVYRARHTESGRVVALKLVAEGLHAGEARLRGEGRAQAALDHPHVVTVYDSGESEHGLYLAMQLVDGPSLAALLRERRVDARRALALLAQVADALDAAHARGLVHRDVKPHNVLVGPGDHAYLADFGLTRAGTQTALTAPDALVGTVAYLAPEVVRGDEASPASDRYAFAAMAFECLAGSTVFPRPSDAAILHAHASDPPPPIGTRRAELGHGLDELFEHALAKDPSERPANATRFVEAVRRRMERDGTIDLPAPPVTGEAELVRDATTDSSIAPVPRAAPAPARPRRWPAALVGALCGAAVVAAAWLALGNDGDDDAPQRVSVDRPGLRYLGADLNGGPGRALDCRGRAATEDSPGCTIVQAALPGATVVVPLNGVIRRWGVRGARGEMALAVLRPRDGGAFQIALSPADTVGSAEVHWFDADMDVERGDILALRLAPGSSVGSRGAVPGATTERWLPAVGGFGRPADRGAGTGFDRELLLRVGMRPGGRRRPTPQVTGSAAERLPDGTVRRRSTIRLEGRPVEFALVQVGDRFVIDQRVRGRRIARIDLPGMRPRARDISFKATAFGEDAGGLDVRFVNEESTRVAEPFYAVTLGAFEHLR